MKKKIIVGIVLAMFVAGIIISTGGSADTRNNIEKMAQTKKVTEVGDYTSEVIKYTKGGVEIGNYATRKIYRNGKLIETIENKRALPAQVRPAQVVPAPGPKAKLVLIDHTNPFWKLDTTVKQDITCWVVHTDEGRTYLYDAVTGKKIGEGIPAPIDKAISLSGFHEEGWPDPWDGFRENAALWCNLWDFSTWNVFAPTYTPHSNYIKDNTCTFRYALAHGGSTSFKTCDGLWITDDNIASWMANRDKMTFAFLGHCAGMCSTGPGTLSNAFRKGSMTDTVTVGFCDPTVEGWPQALNWQDKLFAHANTGVTWKAAFDYANACYPECISMMVFVGDETLSLNTGNPDETTLTIQSEPSGQKAYVDGIFKGYTPVTVTVSGSPHTIKVGEGAPPPKPDLTITDVWTVGDKVHYKVKNTGSTNAGASHTSLTIDGTYKTTVYEAGLSAGAERSAQFSSYSWTCSGSSDNIKVRADCNGEIDEANENNNYMEKTISCSSGCEGIDLVITDIFKTSYGKIGYKIKNQGTYACGSSYTSLYLNGRYTNRDTAGSLNSGQVRTDYFRTSWPRSGTVIKVKADYQNRINECDESNNNMEVTA